jgi:hypothetical protein
VTATEGAPALEGTDTVGAGSSRPAPAGPTASSRAPRLTTVLGLASKEASLLTRSLLLLTGLLAGAATIWILIDSAEPLWWNVAWKIGFGQLILGMAVLIAAQLAAGRPRRNGMAELYLSLPATAGTRTLGQLAGLVGAVPASLLLIVATALTVQLIGAVGVPSVTVLAGGLLLVIAAGAVGIAIGMRFPHPLAGVLGALALLLSSGTSHLGSGGGVWLLPWEWTQDDLSSLPGPLAGYPPVGAHVLEIAGIAALAAALALVAAVGRARAWARTWLTTMAVLAAAVICLAGTLQLRPVPAADVNHLVAEATDPASVQRCTTSNTVRYCLYPDFGALLPSLEAPVNGVLARVPVRPARPLTISQVATLSLDSTLTHGQQKSLVSRWEAELQRGQVSASLASAIYLPVGGWPAFGGRLTDAHFEVALATADWAVHIPLITISGQPCVPLDQAREAIAIWLAILAAHPPAGELQAGLPQGNTGVMVHNSLVPTWTYPGESNGQVDQLLAGPPQTTEAGYLLARAMTGLPEQKVARVLTASWTTWLRPGATDAQFAAALGIRMPTVHVPQIPGGGGHVVAVTSGPGSGPSPVCTS